MGVTARTSARNSIPRPLPLSRDIDFGVVVSLDADIAMGVGIYLCWYRHSRSQSQSIDIDFFISICSHIRIHTRIFNGAAFVNRHWRQSQQLPQHLGNPETEKKKKEKEKERKGEESKLTDMVQQALHDTTR